VSERIYKLQPNRTIQLRGFNDLGAAASMHSATATGFKVSGIFRDPADFCVLTLFDADNTFEHPSLRYLPDTNFAGLTLSFDVHFSGLRNLDSPRYPIIDWPYLDVIRPDGTTANVPLFDPAGFVSGSYTPATAQFTLVDNGLRQWDRVTLWYLNRAFDYLVPQVECAYVFLNQGGGFVHSVTVAGTVYSYTEQNGDADITIAQRIVDALAACPYVAASRGDNTPEHGSVNQVNLRARPGGGQAFPVSSTSNPTVQTLYRVSASSIASDIAAQCNATDWGAVGADIPIVAQASGSTITFTATKAGVDGNALSMYAVSKNAQLTTAEDFVQFAGGNSDATWRVTIDFSARGIPDVRKMWLTFAPPISAGKAFEATEWEAVFTNWSVAGPEDVRRLQVGGPGSFRIEENSGACGFDGPWDVEHGFYSLAYSKVSKREGNTVVISYESMVPHELWIGTSLYLDRGAASVQIDHGPEIDFNTYLNTGLDPAVITRRKVAAGGLVPAGPHTVTIRTKDAKPFYFDYLDIVVPSDIPADLPPRTNVSPALDYSTDHTYKLPPSRILWMFDKLGFAGPMNEYIGVFWWNQRIRTGAVLPKARIDFSAGFVDGDQVWLNVSGTRIGKSVFSTDTPETIARHFGCYVNAIFVGLWAAVSGSSVTLTSHSPTANFQFDLSQQVDAALGSTGTVTITGTLKYTGDELIKNKGQWFVDPLQTPALNRGARDWHADFFAECAARNRELVVASSMELVLPPPEFPARYHNGDPVKTSVGYGSDWWSSHCAFNAAMLEYQKAVFGTITDLMASAGLRPSVQFGEYCWWYFPGGPDGTMALYDDDTNAAAQGALGRPLQVFSSADDDPLVNGGADATFLRNRLRDHVAALIAHIRSRHPGAKFEVLFPYDVNYPRPAGAHGLGGRLLRYINFPEEWARKETSGFDCLKMEGLDWGAVSRDLDLAREVMKFPLKSGWPVDSVRYMLPIFNGGCPWLSEYRMAKGLKIPAINLWAFDHVCIFGLMVTEPGRPPRAVRFN
jgi:hypothetical protein